MEASQDVPWHLLGKDTEAPWLERVDPRTRLLGVFFFCCVLAFLGGWLTLGLALGGTIGLAIAADWHPRKILLQLLRVSAAISPLLLTLPWSTPGEVFWSAGPLRVTVEGMTLAGQTFLKVNTLVLFTTACLGGLDQFRLGHALVELRISPKLALLVILVSRYLYLVYDEYQRMRRVLKVRGFRPRLNRHSLRTLGRVVAWLVVKSAERSQRIQAAMKCRGFSGKFPKLFPSQIGPEDRLFVSGLVAVLALLALLGAFAGLP
ncbi:MAG: energy-coupling factor transporter transmembrane protein EcfT [Thermoguttaceae bacterium]|nr:energy-coupling factor transporter transmembrane protein EcfT [Thermoguttaceae bacterium]MDW8078895.1 energy-coupling factor transporter transmembrane component T [Thermoguttaceae bacterium]